MFRILFINSVCNGSTGKICKDLYDLASKDGNDCCIAYGRGDAPLGYNTIKIGNNFDVYRHVALTRLFDKHGFGSKRATKKFLKQVDEFSPDIIHIHNIHGYYINIEILFNYLKSHPKIKVIWTLHDCWAFTGHCSYFSISQCSKWQNGCQNCQFYKDYPKSLFSSNSNVNYNLKKKLFCTLKNMQLVSPSCWLKNLVQYSFLNIYDIKVINNGIDTQIFKKNDSSIVNDKKIILGVANIWDSRKGLKYFIELDTKINHDKFLIYIVGLNDEQLKNLPTSIKGIKKTESLEELVHLYQTANVFFNPTLEDNYPTVNLEAQACGTPVFAFDNGGTKETLFSTSCVVKDVDDVVSKLDNIDYYKENFEIDYSKVDSNLLFSQYLKLYERILR